MNILKKIIEFISEFPVSSSRIELQERLTDELMDTLMFDIDNLKKIK